MNEEKYTIIIAATHIEPAEGRTNGIAPSGYGYVLVHGKNERGHYGYGGEKSTEAMSAHGLTRASTQCLIACEEPQITVVAANIGTEKYVTHFVPKWLEEMKPGGQLYKDNDRTWRDLCAMSAMGNVSWRKPADQAERKQLKKAQELADDAVAKAVLYFQLHPDQRGQAGIVATDEDEQTAELSAAE